MSTYAELQVTSNFSFLEGGSHPEELVRQAQALGYAAVAITDRNSLAGVVRAHVVAHEAGMRLVVGTRLDLRDGASLLCYPTDRAAYGRLCRLLTEGKRRAPKGKCYLDRADVVAFSEGQLLVVLPPDEPDEGFPDELAYWAQVCKKRVYLAGTHRFRGDDQAWLDRLARLGARMRTPIVATNDVLYHHPDRRELQDVLTCVRDGVRLKEAGWRLQANAERHLKEPTEMARLFARHPEAVARTVEIAERCHFSMGTLKYEYPEEAFEGQPPQQRLEQLTWAGAAQKWPGGIPDRIKDDLLKELNLIQFKDYARYFLTVHDVVRFAESKEILCQGRGSAANSAVCYCLGITKVDPSKLDLLFERFLSFDRNEPPDIDVDFEHERREEVIQHIYEKYTRERTALCATVIHYRRRSALRDVGKVMGLSDDVIDALAGTSQFSRHRHEHHDPRDDPEPKTLQRLQEEAEAEAKEEAEKRGPLIDHDHIRQVGIDPHEPMVARTLELAAELVRFPRHLSQHVGGFVISRGRLDELGPIENAAMKDRTVLCWDKDDIDALGLVKVDVLALGMLSCLRRGFTLLREHKGLELGLDTIPQEDPNTYKMLCEADSVGVFQVESRAQMTMLPRLKPANYYDLVIEVAIVRPGPIQGGMVHPYLRRRDGIDPVTYPSPALEKILSRTKGVPLFQEQAMKIAIVGAGFTPEQADKLRKAMATFRRTGEVSNFHDEFLAGMSKNGYSEEFARSVFSQIEGFGEYGFPESHAASFALLVYASAWMKRHHPEVFACAILNSQPMGFYAPAQLVRDARNHHVEVRPADVNHSDWDCSLEPYEGGKLALRLGLRLVQGIGQTEAEMLVASRGAGYESPHALWRRAGLRKQSLDKLAEGDCFGSMGLSRRQAGWEVKALGAAPPPLLALIPEVPAEPAPLPVAGLGEEVNADYASLKLSLKEHPLALLRPRLSGNGIVPAQTLWERHRGRIAVAGLVIGRQRPGTAKGVIFMTLEDETGIANVVIWNHVFERFRIPALASRLALVNGRVERDGKDGKVIHLVAETITDLTPMLHSLALPGAPVPRYKSRDFQ